MADSSQEAVAAFMSLTGADAAAAASYIEMAGGVVETAVNLFLEMGSGGSSGGTGSSSSVNTGSSEFDAASVYGGGLEAQDEHQDVRAPDEQKRQRLMDPSEYSRNAATHGGGGGSRAPGQPQQKHIFRDFRREADLAAARRKRKSGSAAEDTNGGGKHGGEASLSSSSSSSSMSSSSSLSSDEFEKNKRLADLFRPPAEIMHTGDFAEARAEAKVSSKWLMVNIQKEDCFDTHRLNRDTWNNDTLQNILDSLCVFWQQYDNTSMGATYCQRYQVHDFPHVALIDPRTGRLCWQRTGFVGAELLCEKISDFCSRSNSTFDDEGDGALSLDSPCAKKRATSSAADAAVATLASSLSGTAASSTSPALGGTSGTAMPSESEGQVVGSSVAAVTAPAATLSQHPPPAEEFGAVALGAEPGAGDARSTRIGFRLPAVGKSQPINVQRRFLKTDSVEAIFRFVHEKILNASAGDGAASSRPFDIVEVVPPKASLRQFLGTSKVLFSFLYLFLRFHANYFRW